MDPLEFVGRYTDQFLEWYYNYDLTVSQMYLSVATFLICVLPVIIYFFEQRQKDGPLAIPPVTEIAALYTYPVKSCRGIKLKSAKLFKTGIELDRMWMFVDAEKHEFLTIRQNPNMVLISTGISADDELVISIKGKSAEIRVPAHPSDEWLQENTKLVDCNVGLDCIDGWEYDAALMDEFSEFFGQPVRLLRKGPGRRALKGNADANIIGREEEVGFADQMPVLIASQSSMDELNARLTADGEDKITIERFRPNIIVTGISPWAEDNWKTVRLLYPSSEFDTQLTKWLTLDVVARCARCQVPNVDPETAEKHEHEPWNHLMGYRRIDEGIKIKPCFGMLCVPRHEGLVKIGMKLLVTGTTEKHRYIKSM